MTSEQIPLPTALRRVPQPLPGAAPQQRLAELFPPYRCADPAAFPPYALHADDIDSAFFEGARSYWAQHRPQPVNLQCVALEQLAVVGDRRPAAPVELPRASEHERREGLNVALVELQGAGQIKAIARLLRHCRAPTADVCRVSYLLDSLRVLPAQRDKGFDRVLASAIGGLIGRELEHLVHAVRHALSLSFEVKFGCRSGGPEAAVLQRIVAARLRDELVAQDSMLQLDGKLSRFHPLQL